MKTSTTDTLRRPWRNGRKMIERLADPEAFRARSHRAWARNRAYWLSQPLRHVVDTGEWILNRLQELSELSGKETPTLIDMGCGSSWILEGLAAAGLKFQYVGVDNDPEFIGAAQVKFASIPTASFVLADVDRAGCCPDLRADIIINAFNLFELADINAAFSNAGTWLKSGGRMLISSIDKTYLILALTSNKEDFFADLRDYQILSGTKFGFQKIDLGGELSDELEYPSVLYSLSDIIAASSKHNFRFEDYTEITCTGRAIPKIYFHLQLVKTP